MPVRNSTVFLLFVAALALAAHTGAQTASGTRYQMQINDAKNTPPIQPLTIEVQARNVRIDLPEDVGRNSTVIFRADQPAMIVADNNKKTYLLVDQALMNQIQQQMGGMTQQMNDALAKLPPERRQAAEQMMKQRMGGAGATAAPEAPVEVRATSEHGTQSGFSTTKLDVFRGAQKTGEIWVTPWSSLPGGTDAQSALAAMNDFRKKLLTSIGHAPAPQAAPLQKDGLDYLATLQGFPADARTFKADGSLESEITLQSATAMTLPASEFEVPAGYKQQTIGGGN